MMSSLSQQQQEQQQGLSQSQSSGKRRRRPAPPMRLSWPGATSTAADSSSLLSSSSSTGISHSQPSRSKSDTLKPPLAANSNKRQRTLLASFAHNTDANGDDNNNTNELWIDRYAPTCRQELCVAPKKVTEIAHWLDHGAERLLILVGRPGIGKSTLIRILAHERHWPLLEWNDSLSTYGAYSSMIETQSPLNSFEQFLQQGGLGFAALNLQVVSTTTTLHRNTAPSTNNQNISNNKQPLILLEELPNIAENNDTNDNHDRFRHVLTQHVLQSNAKTVWIYSDGSEGQHKPQELERHIAPSVLYNPAYTKIVHINPATKPQLKKSLERIAKAEHFVVSKDFCEHMHMVCGGDVRYAIMSLQFDQAGGAVAAVAGGRGIHNNNNNKSRRGAKSSKSKTDKALLSAPSTTTTIVEHSRDTHWTAFHALGKILYAKREPVDNKTEAPPASEATSVSTGDSNQQDDRPPLTFDPEGVLEHCDLDLGHALTYLGFHCVDFFTEMEELSTTFDLYSDACYLLEQTTNYNYQRGRQRQRGMIHQTNTTVTCPIFPEGYVTSLTSRAIAHANRHPAPNRFRQLQAPKVLEIRRKQTENAAQLHRLQQRFSILSVTDQTVTSASASSMSSLPSFVMDQLPFLRIIMSNEVNASLGQLHTSASEHIDRLLEQQEAEEAAVAARLEQEQEQILKMDDIVDFSSDDDDDDNDHDGREDQNIPSNADSSSSQQQQPTMPLHSGVHSSQSNLQPENPYAAPPTQPTAKMPVKPIKRIVNPYRTKASKPNIPLSSSALGLAAVTSRPSFNGNTYKRALPGLGPAKILSGPNFNANMNTSSLSGPDAVTSRPTISLSYDSTHASVPPSVVSSNTNGSSDHPSVPAGGGKPRFVGDTLLMDV